jgi:hypothetical protein
MSEEKQESNEELNDAWEKRMLLFAMTMLIVLISM